MDHVGPAHSVIAMVGSQARLGRVVALATALGFSCGDDSGAAGPVVEDRVVAVPFSFTRVLDEATMAALQSVSEDALTLRFSGSPAALAGVTSDNVLVVGRSDATPTGLVVRVVEARADGDGTVVEVTPIPFIYAFRSLDVEVARGRADEAGLRTIPSALGGSASGNFSFVHDVDWSVFDGDGDDATTDDRVLVTGRMDASVGLTFSLAFDWVDVEDKLEDLLTFDIVDVLTDIGFEMKLIATLSAGVDLNVSGRAALKFEKEIPIGAPILLPPVSVPPVYLQPVLATRGGVVGGASALLEVTMSESATLTIGIKASGAVVTPVVSGPTLTTPTASASVQSSAHARAWIEPRVEMLMWGFIGPTVGLEPYVRVEADIGREPCWTVFGGLDARLGVTLKAGPLILISESIPANLVEQAFADGGCSIPDGPGGGALDPLFDPWSATFDGALVSATRWDEVPSLTLAHDGRYLVTHPGAHGLLKVGDDGALTWARTYARDIRDPDRVLVPHQVVPSLDGGLHLFTALGGVLKTDAAGRLERAALLDFAANRLTHVGGSAIALDAGAWVAGDTPYEDGTRDAWLARFAPDGSLAFARRIAGSADERPTAVLPLPDGGVLVVGYALRAGRFESWVARLDSEGASRWIRRVFDCDPVPGAGERNLTLRAALLTSDGDLVVAGRMEYGEFRTIMARIKDDGTVSWTRSYEADGLGLDLSAITLLESGGFIGAGVDVAVNPGDDAFFVAEMDSIGRIAWMRRYDAPEGDYQAALAYSPADRGFLVAVGSDSFDADPGMGDASLWVSKLPRRDGLVTLAAGAPIAFDAAPPRVESTSCLATQTYDGVVVEPIAGALLPLNDVVARELDVAATRLSQ